MSRRLLSHWLPIAIVVALASLAWTSTASATARTMPCNSWNCGPTTAPVPLSYTGWVYLKLPKCPVGAHCFIADRTHADGWRWTGYAWTRAQVREGSVYVTPYTGQWRWVYTYESGWVAVTGHTFTYGRYATYR